MGPAARSRRDHRLDRRLQGRQGFGSGILTIFKAGTLVERNEGEFVDGKQTGHGMRRNPKGRYTGNFKDGLFEGHGLYVASDGMRYDGEWKTGNLDGYGKLSFASGLKYEGHFRANTYNGFGRMTYPDGGQYEGEYICSARRTAPASTGTPAARSIQGNGAMAASGTATAPPILASSPRIAACPRTARSRTPRRRSRATAARTDQRLGRPIEEDLDPAVARIGDARRSLGQQLLPPVGQRHHSVLRNAEQSQSLQDRLAPRPRQREAGRRRLGEIGVAADKELPLPFAALAGLARRPSLERLGDLLQHRMTFGRDFGQAGLEEHPVRDAARIDRRRQSRNSTPDAKERRKRRSSCGGGKAPPLHR
jgi:hypothetical protein